MPGECLPDLGHELDKVLRVAVGHVQADELHRGEALQDGGQVVEVALRGGGV